MRKVCQSWHKESRKWSPFIQMKFSGLCTDTCAAMLRYCAPLNIRKLDLRNINLIQNGLMALSQLKGLKCLNLSGLSRKNTYDFVPSSVRCLRIEMHAGNRLHHLTNLTSLDVRFAPISKSVIIYSQLSKLKRLACSHVDIKFEFEKLTYLKFGCYNWLHEYKNLDFFIDFSKLTELHLPPLFNKWSEFTIKASRNHLKRITCSVLSSSLHEAFKAFLCLNDIEYIYVNIYSTIEGSICIPDMTNLSSLTYLQAVNLCANKYSITETSSYKLVLHAKCNVGEIETQTKIVTEMFCECCCYNDRFCDC